MKLLFITLAFYGIQAVAQISPEVAVRFANPGYDFPTRTYCVDVEFQCNTAGIELFDMNLRFWYPDLLLEFITAGDFQGGYGAVSPNPPLKSTLNPSFGPSLFGFEGSPEYINGAIQLLTTSNPIYISTTGWTKLFNICFLVDDIYAPYNDYFAPSILWDLEEDPANGGFLIGSEGVVMTVRNPSNPNQTISAAENAVPLNWVYDGIPGTPYGFPEPQLPVSTRVAPVIRIDSVAAEDNNYITFPVRAWSFFDISDIILTLDYNPVVLEYCCTTPDPGIGCNFNVNSTIPGRIQIFDASITADYEDGSTLMDITFKYLGGNTSLSWFDDGPGCQFLNANTGQFLYDQPLEDFYFNGRISPGFYIWTGASSTGWDSPANWQPNLVPHRFSNVTVPGSPAPAFWPNYNGNLFLGAQCRNLTLTGTAELQVTGDLVINPGHTLSVNGDALIQIGGDWMNSGSFIPGTGIVEFNGPEPGMITDGVSPLSDPAGLQLSTFPAGMVPLSGSAPGFNGNNAHMDVNIGFSFPYLGTTYTQVRLNTNGWLSFNLSGEDAVTHCNFILFNTADPTAALAPWWDDLNADGNAKVAYQTTGNTPNRVFTAEWNNILAYSFGSTARLNFQVKLYETSGIIEFCYGNVTAGTHTIHEGASVGLKDATGGAGHFREATYGTNYLMIGCLLSQEDWPQVNYRFTPAPHNQQETFYRIIVSPSAPLTIESNVVVTGTE